MSGDILVVLLMVGIGGTLKMNAKARESRKA
jgi:hypothetical protein